MIASWVWALGVAVIVSPVTHYDRSPLFVRRAQNAVFDLYQRLSPRTPAPTTPVQMVDIDDASLADLTQALNDLSTKAEASSIIRGLLTEIRLVPEGGILDIELVGELAGLLALGQKETAREIVSPGRSVTTVAGAGFGLCRTTSRIRVPDGRFH